MNPKNALTFGLLLFVAASIVVLAVKALGPGPEMKGPGRQFSGTSSDEGVSLTDGVVVYYLHGEQRCPTCRAMEANTRAAIERGFADRLNDGSMVIREVNYEAAGNEHYVRDFAIPAPAPAVVVERIRGGKQQEWKNLDRAFELTLTADKKAYMEYVRQETKAVVDGPVL